MRTADWLVDMGPGRGRARRRRRRRGHRDGRDAEQGVGHRPVPLGRAADRDPAAARGGPRPLHRPRRRQHNLKGIDVEFPLGEVRRRHRRLRLGQVDARQRDRLQGAREPAATGCASSRASTTSVEGIEVFDKVIDIDQKPIGRTPRSNPATYIELFTHIRELYSLTPEAKVRGYKPGRFTFNVRGGRCETCKGDGHDQDRDALPARRLRAVRDLPRAPLQPGDAGGALQGQVDRRRARDVGRGGARLLRQDPEAAAAAADAARRRPRLHQARPAGDDALRRRGAARQARGGALQGRDRPDALHPRRADDRPALRRHREAARGAAAARRRRQHGARDRAQPRRDQAGRLGRSTSAPRAARRAAS